MAVLMAAILKMFQSTLLNEHFKRKKKLSEIRPGKWFSQKYSGDRMEVCEHLPDGYTLAICPWDRTYKIYQTNWTVWSRRKRNV